MVVFTEQLVVDVHQLTLAHRRRGLFAGDVLGPLPQTQLAHAHADGTGGYQNQLVPGVADVAHGFAQGLHPADIQLSRGVGQGRCTDFDYDAHKHPSALFMSINWNLAASRR